ncbi:hypothetical protein HK096_010217 [Nowakowskiella sp. JEL0078]|nr:hypothetical protein HK096_010217 [Nowakowskiella sp. JEL0078]
MNDYPKIAYKSDGKFLVDELLVLVFSFLSPSCVLKIACVSKQFYRVSVENRVWKLFVSNSLISLPSKNTLALEPSYKSNRPENSPTNPRFAATRDHFKIVPKRAYREEFRLRNCNLCIDNIGDENWHSGIVWDSFYDEELKSIFSISNDASVRIWSEKEVSNENFFEWKATIDLSSVSSKNPKSTTIGATASLCRSRDKFLCSWEGHIQLRDILTTELISRFEDGGTICSIKSLDSSGFLFASGGTDNLVKVWDTRAATRSPCFEYSEEGTVLTICVPGQDEQFGSTPIDCIVSGGRYKSISILDWRQRKLRQAIYTGSVSNTISSPSIDTVFVGGGLRNSFGVVNKFNVQGTFEEPHLRKFNASGFHQAFVAGSSTINLSSGVSPPYGLNVLASCAWDGTVALFFDEESKPDRDSTIEGSITFPLPVVSAAGRLLVKDRKAAFTSVRWCGRSGVCGNPRLLLSNFRGISVLTFEEIGKLDQPERKLSNNYRNNFFIKDTSVHRGKKAPQGDHELDDDIIDNREISRRILTPFSLVNGI